ncbi:little elongation complex subunit 1 [Lepus europaeus]|uniref:little elongation complex subunit 1 n=1 Tax=Lepus europaeus TaxID=9983 RepID=UPI002B461BC3|nr:little elongation complex subunit 1 [Lepus europaeus]
MMPGETHSAAPGTAADLSRCQGCASLQQNLNEYVEALITLKQKIINTDNLLTEYQKKCDELQFARRENSTLHHQVEQMLQKISPLQKCQEELGSLKAELEEKKSSLKLYQDTQQEYTRVKEECLKSDAQKKKLEAKVKKLEEAAVRQTQDFKQLSNEKKILEKEFKKTQEKLDEFSKQKNEKELRHIGTQISSDSYGSIDKRKVKLLLKELWLCVNTAHRLPGEGRRWVLEQPARDSASCKASGEGGALPPAQSGPLQTPDGQACLADLSMELEGDFSSHENVETERPSGANDSADHAFHKDGNPEVSVRSATDGGSTAVSDQEHCLDEDLQAAIDFFKLPPPLLSPVPSPPLMSSPPLGSLPSPLAPETYFGEYTDSSDSDAAQPQTSAESVSEDDTAEPRDYFGLSTKSTGSGTWEEKPTSQEVCRVTAAGPETSAAALREPSAVPCEHWTLSSEFAGGRTRDISDEAKTQIEVRELEKSVQAEEPLPKPARTVWTEKLSSNPEQEKQAATGKSASCSPLGKRPLKELTEVEQKTLLSKGIGSRKSDFTKWAVPEDVASQSDPAALSDRFQGLSGEAAKARGDVQGSTVGESSGPEHSRAGYAVDASRPDAEASFSSSSTSVVMSVSRDPQSCQLQLVSDTDTPTQVLPTKLHPSEQKLPTETLNTLHLQSEPAEWPGGGSDLGKGSRALSPAWGASDVSDLKTRERECTTIIKSVTDLCSFPHSVFMKATKDGQCESQDPRIELLLPKSGFTSVIDSRADSVKSASGFVKSTSWHHSDLLRRGGEEILKAKLEHEQKTDHQRQMGIPSMPNRGATSNLELPGENTNPVEFRPAASLLPNQVSVIMKQSRPEKGQGAKLEPLRLHRSEPALGAEHSDRETDRAASVAKCAGGDGTALSIKEASLRSTSPDVSTSWRKLDFDSPGGSLPGESVGCSTNRTLAFSSENIPVQTQDVGREAAVQGEVQEQRPFPQTTDPDSSGVEGSGLPPACASAAPGGFPVEDTPCGEAARCGSEALAVAKDSPGTPPNARDLLKLQSKACGALPECLVTVGSAASSACCRKDEEAPDASQSSLPGTLYSYTGIREGGEDDTEVEESEAFSCSEGEHDPEAVVGSTQQDAPDASQRDAGAAEPGAAEAEPSAEVGRLTSALQDCNISAFPDLDRLSTSEVVLFLESCQLKDYNSGDSVSECSSKGSLHKEVNKEVKQSAPSGGESREGPCEEAALGASEEWGESEDDGESSRDASQLTQCSLEALSEVFTKIGQELQISYEGCQDHPGNLFLNINSSLTTEDAEGKVPSQEMASSSSRAPELLPLLASVGARSGSPAPDGPREHLPSRPEEARQTDGGEAARCPASAAEPTTGEQSSDEAETTFQCQISTVTSEVINVLINKDQNLVIEKGDNWTIISGVSIGPDVDQVIVCATPEDPAPRDPGQLEAESISEASVEKSPDMDATGPACREPLCGSTLPCEDVSSSGQSANFDKSRLRNRPVKPSIWISSQIYDQTFETQVAASDHTYYNSKLEPCGKNKTRPKISNKEPSNKPAKTLASNKVETHPGEVSQSCSGERSNVKTPRNQTQPVLANADTSTPTECSPDTLSKIRQEVGPPLPPLLAPLVATPPRTSQPLSPLISSSSPSSPASPVSQISPLCDTPAPPVLSPWLEDPRHVSPPGPSPSPSAASAGERVVSSPLQFCAATPKHALPVPGRLPACAPSHTAVGAPPQENSVKILDTMYPELSARARTLNLLKGNIQRTRGSSADSKNLPGSVSALIGFKAITSTSTAFVKTGGSSAGDSGQEKSRGSGAQQDSGGKRTLSTCTPRSAKRLRLGSGSPEPESRESSAGVHKSLQRNLPQAEAGATEEGSSSVRAVVTESQLPSKPKETVESHDKAIADALKKIAESSFDLLPVIRSHVYVGNISKKPVMRDQEKEVVYEFSTTKKHLAECLLHSILSELKIQKTSLDHSYIHALCRVYVGICRQLGDLERARLFCYSLLKEDFPESEKLTLFIANMWHDIFLSQSVINKAMQLVARQRAKGEVLNCLRAFLNWEKNAPVDVGFMVSKLLLTIQLCPKTEFQSSEKFGEDLNDHTWEYIFAIDLLCCHQKWIWTHDNIISKELWPVMDKWIKYRKGHANIAYTPDIIIASILRLIGRLGQLGLKEGFPSAVKNISSVIGMFIQHAQDEDIPWGVQLAAVYALCDLSPSNPAEIAKILEAWRREASSSIPSAVASYLEEVSSLSAEGLG